MKYFIFDSSNDGVLWTGPNLVVANKLKEGLIDCDLGSINVNNITYNTLSVENVNTSHYYWDGKNGKITIMPLGDINDVYTKKKQLAKLRSNSMYSLYRYVVWAYRKTQSFPHDGIDSEIDSILRECDPDNNIFSFGIVEYALTCGMSNHEAYKQLRLRIDNYKSQRMRVYSYFDYFSSLINKSFTDNDIEVVNNDIYKKFIKDSFI